MNQKKFSFGMTGPIRETPTPNFSSETPFFTYSQTQDYQPHPNKTFKTTSTQTPPPLTTPPTSPNSQPHLSFPQIPPKPLCQTPQKVNIKPFVHITSRTVQA